MNIVPILQNILGLWLPGVVALGITIQALKGNVDFASLIKDEGGKVSISRLTPAVLLMAFAASYMIQVMETGAMGSIDPTWTLALGIGLAPYTANKMKNGKPSS